MGSRPLVSNAQEVNNKGSRPLASGAIEQSNKRLDCLLGNANHPNDKTTTYSVPSEGWMATIKSDATCNDCQLDDPSDSGGSDFDSDEEGELVTEQKIHLLGTAGSLPKRLPTYSITTETIVVHACHQQYNTCGLF